eukprot:5231391-Lingulodinium_polyedra.AAC.1
MRTPQKTRAAECALGLKALHNLRVTRTCARPTVRPQLLARMLSVLLALVGHGDADADAGVDAQADV